VLVIRADLVDAMVAHARGETPAAAPAAEEAAVAKV
jgi:hypothetical protein